jgi:hypothetical protein
LKTGDAILPLKLGGFGVKVFFLGAHGAKDSVLFEIVEAVAAMALLENQAAAKISISVNPASQPLEKKR